MTHAGLAPALDPGRVRLLQWQEGTQGFALVDSLTADDARVLAANLVRLADQAEAGDAE
jgi:hypothetical protein